MLLCDFLSIFNTFIRQLFFKIFKMLKNIAKGALFFCLAIFSHFVVGQQSFQKGFIITLEQDTIYGYIDFRGETKNAAICIFKNNDSGQTLEYHPNSIRAYKFDSGNYYVSKEVIIDGEMISIFAEFLFEGVYDLYFYRRKRHISYFIEDENGKVWELKNEELRYHVEGKEYSKMSKEYISTLKVLFSNFTDLYQEIENSERTHESLIKITRSYHEYICPNEECVVYQEKLPKVLFRISPIIGVNSNLLNLHGRRYSEFSFGNSLSPVIGILYNTSIPRFNYKLSFEIGSRYMHNYYSSTYSIGDFYKQHYDLYLNIHSLRNDVNFRYSFPRGKIRPFISMGGSLLLHLQQNTQFINENESNFIVRSYEYDDNLLPKTLLGFNAHLGVASPIDSKFSWFMDLNFSSSKGTNIIMKSLEIKTSIFTLGVTVGIFL
jgi:hypothetical protein